MFCLADRHLDVGTQIWWNLCLLGDSAAVGIDMHWACHLLGMHASQSPHPKLLMSLSRPASLSSSLGGQNGSNLWKAQGGVIAVAIDQRNESMLPYEAVLTITPLFLIHLLMFTAAHG